MIENKKIRVIFYSSKIVVSSCNGLSFLYTFNYFYYVFKSRINGSHFVINQKKKYLYMYGKYFWLLKPLPFKTINKPGCHGFRSFDTKNDLGCSAILSLNKYTSYKIYS